MTVSSSADATLLVMEQVQLFAPEFVHYTPTLEVRGQAAMRQRVTSSYEKWVAPGEHVFRPVPNADTHHDAVRFNWEMVHLPTGEVVAVGFEFLTLTDDGLIRTDHQFIDR